ncbi:hypothetical protein BOTBODRAFT_117813, partial [Botryobasidium botryosum FD-172 SS1]
VVPFGVTYEKIGTIQRRLAWPLHKDDTLFRVDDLRITIFIFFALFFRFLCTSHNVSTFFFFIFINKGLLLRSFFAACMSALAHLEGLLVLRDSNMVYTTSGGCETLIVNNLLL